MNNPHVKQVLSKVDGFMNKYPAFTFKDKFAELETKTGFPKALFFLLSTVLAFGFLSLVGGIKLIVDLVGFLYPAYMSFKSMDSGNKDDVQWLTYWVVFSFIAIFENVFGFLVFFIPFYQYIKAAGIVWLYYPKTRGAQVVYEQGLRPMIMPYLEKASTSSTNKGD